MKRIVSNSICIVLILVGFYLIYRGAIEPNVKKEPATIDELELFEMKQGDVFEAGGYFSVDDVRVVYNGSQFIVENKSNDIYMITCSVYGQKSNGEYEELAMIFFAGPDETQYQKNKEENGWAVKQNTNKINPQETLVAEINVNGYVSFLAEIPKSFDIDNDGYYDIAFRFSKQENINSTTTSTCDKLSDYFKIKVK